MWKAVSASATCQASLGLTDDLVVDVHHWKVADPPVGGNRGTPQRTVLQRVSADSAKSRCGSASVKELHVAQSKIRDAGSRNSHRATQPEDAHKRRLLADRERARVHDRAQVQIFA